ncbi:N-acetylmuramoyl-L-alanine amidase family protein [Halonatronum saccharophilum]|uniref:N-acetylmuramoyl-L-alanine amidase family protein n=1 Tax=Halonatronum saccharophilum TaxID=150060 RepID=UPI00047FC038|nr:N-acetylmuramoyl-L-alanine amidase family protein [Halonatronum saccharophilum]
MKVKYTLVILVVIALIISSNAVKGQGPTLLFNGDLVDSAIEVVNGRTMISARFVSDYFGDDVKWDNEDKRLEILNDNIKINLEMNNRVALVNDQPVYLDVSPQIIKNQVMLPLRFLTKVYGGDLSWDNQAKATSYNLNRVNDVEVQSSSSSTDVVIRTDRRAKYEVELYHQPTRVVIDIYNVGLNDISNLIEVNDSILDGVRISQFSFDPAKVRIVADVDSMSGYDIIQNGSNLTLRIDRNIEVATSSIISTNYESDDIKLNPSKRTIVIDAGHGGSDPGAIGASGLYEKDVAYDISLKVDQLLRDEGYNTIMTRDGDYFVPLTQRAEIANQRGADLFVSVHANAHPNPDVGGTETYAHWNASKDNWAFAWYVHSEVVNRIGLRDHGLKAANFAVLRRTEIPAILLEVAFLSNAKEDRLLGDPAFQEEVAYGVVEGINKYYQNKN